jgi:histidyl-tRNA synthetase
MSQKPGIPKGTRDFSPTEMARRNYMLDIIQKQFELFGFRPIETPSFENAETLLGKYGDEGDRLIFKILNSGDFLAGIPDEVYKKKESAAMANVISEKALRYDLTVPFARYVVMHQHELEFPFKRYQVQPVWRADRPQKGRFREFYQCDADVIGTSSLWQEVEFIQLYDAVLNEMGLQDACIRLNHRKILSGIAEVTGAGAQLIALTVALDKLDKIGREAVMEELLANGIAKSAVEKMEPLFNLAGNNEEKIRQLALFLGASPEGLQGLKEMEFLVTTTERLGLAATSLQMEVTLARGLTYYTGAIVEVAAPKKVQIGSIGGGGRYDNLTGIFGLKGMSGVGISFGLDRMYLVLEELGLFPKELETTIDVLFINFGEAEALQSLALIKKLRQAGITAELYPDAVKVKKQLYYADRRHIPRVALIGERELQQGTCILKDMKNGEQEEHTVENLVAVLKQKKSGLQ